MKIRQNIYRHLCVVCAAFLMIGASLFLLFGDLSGSHFIQRFSIFVIPVGVVALIFSTIGAVYLVYRLFAYKYILLVDERGFSDYSTMSAVGFVPWEVVESIYVLNIPVSNQVMVGVRV